jgi:hypothetical protein
MSCSGDGGGGPQPEPFEATHCAVLWYRARAAGRFDLYKVEMPAADWTSGSHAYDGTSRLGVFYYGLLDADADGLFEQYEDAASATSGDFTITSGGLDDGDTVTFQDTQEQSYFGLGNVLVAVGGTGGFEGVWSSHEIEDGGASPAFAEDASIALAYSGSSLAFGSASYGAFGYCWQDPPPSSAFARWRPTSIPQ